MSAPTPDGAGRRRPAWLDPPGGLPLWLSGGAFALALIALVVTVVDGDPAEPGPGAGTARPGSAATPSGSASATPAPPAAASSPTSRPSAAGPATVPPGGTTTCPGATVTVSDARSLTAALAAAAPGTSIRMTGGTYADRFVATAAGTEAQPIFLCGDAAAVIDAGGVDGGYGFHLDGASWWRLVGFTVRNAQKGVMADGAEQVVIDGLTVEQIGDEAIHLRKFSTDNVVRNNTVRETGKRRDRFGEGIYIGTAESNWCEISDCKPDNSDRNTIQRNEITAVTAEPIDIKEGTTGGVVSGNTFDGSALSGSHADSWVDVKGNDWLIENNVGRNSIQDGFQTHEILDGWGTGNVFRGNTAEVNGPGFGFSLTPVNDNKVSCDNKVSGAAEGFANIDCS